MTAGYTCSVPVATGGMVGDVGEGIEDELLGRRRGPGLPSESEVLGDLADVLVRTRCGTINHLIEQVSQPQAIQ